MVFIFYRDAYKDKKPRCRPGVKKGKKAKEAYQKAKITFRNEAKTMGMIIGTKSIV